jgi:hypothetical protein
MPLRDAGPMPPALEFMRFLASSITFMVNLREVGVFVDEHCIGRIKKLPGTIQAVDVPGELKRSSPLSIMNVKEIQCHRESGLWLCCVGADDYIHLAITIEAEVVHAVLTGTGKSSSQGIGESHNKVSLFSSGRPPPQLGSLTSPQHPGDPTRLYRTAVDLTVFTAEVKVELDEKRSAELLRSTKKQPPSQLKYGLIYVSS